MANVDNDTLELWCIIHGESTPFKVIAPIHGDIDDLTQRIYEIKKDLDPGNLFLWKVTSFYRPTQTF